MKQIALFIALFVACVSTVNAQSIKQIRSSICTGKFDTWYENDTTITGKVCTLFVESCVMDTDTTRKNNVEYSLYTGPCGNMFIVSELLNGVMTVYGDNGVDGTMDYVMYEDGNLHKTFTDSQAKRFAVLVDFLLHG